MKFYTSMLGAVMILLLSGPALCQAPADTLPDGLTVDYKVDLVSRYIWRGLDFGHAPSIQPDVNVTWKGFTLGAWGAYKTTGEGEQETDLYLSKNIGPLTLAIWDYWSFSDTAAMDFFDYREKSTAHLLEAQILLEGGETLPFNLLGSYFFYGSDSTKSLYFELQYLHSFAGTDFTAFAGYSPKGKYYVSTKGFVNIGIQMSRDIEITDRWKLPLSLSLIYNPDAKSMYLVAGFSL